MDPHYNSSVQVWLAKREVIPGLGATLTFDPAVTKQKFVTIVDIMDKNILASEYRWFHGNGSIRNLPPVIATKIAPAVRALIGRDKVTLAVLASYRAWYDIDRVQVVRYCEAVGGPYEKKTICSTCCSHSSCFF